jgi:hypothetical protein
MTTRHYPPERLPLVDSVLPEPLVFGYRPWDFGLLSLCDCLWTRGMHLIELQAVIWTDQEASRREKDCGNITSGTAN